jgi:hypothetical protein
MFPDLSSGGLASVYVGDRLVAAGRLLRCGEEASKEAPVSRQPLFFADAIRSKTIRDQGLGHRPVGSCETAVRSVVGAP